MMANFISVAGFGSSHDTMISQGYVGQSLLAMIHSPRQNFLGIVEHPGQIVRIGDLIDHFTGVLFKIEEERRQTGLRSAPRPPPSER